MSTLSDVTADQPPAANLRAGGGLTAEEAASLAEELTAYHHHFAPFFYRREQRQWAEVYLRGLLTADGARKNVEAMALRLLGVGPPTERQVRALQQFIGQGAWDDQAILAEHQRLVNETLGEEDGVLIIDGSDFPKHGQHSAGVARETVRKHRQKGELPGGGLLGVCQPQRSDFA
jgi:SRSO17 transposase